ncbi:hypothetical protein SCA6_000978 [Theobroma cacao]
MSTQFLINDEQLKYVLATIAVTMTGEKQFPKGKHSLKMIAVPSLNGESFLPCGSGASINDKIATDCLKHVKSGTLGCCMICETMLTRFSHERKKSTMKDYTPYGNEQMFGISIIYETYFFQIVGKTFPAGSFQDRGLCLSRTDLLTYPSGHCLGSFHFQCLLSPGTLTICRAE